MDEAETKSSAHTLIDSLMENPERFYEEGLSFELLQEYFEGFPQDTLVPLLESKDKWVKREGIWILSELGIEGRGLIDHVLKMTDDEDIFVCSYALEIIANCAHGDHAGAFAKVFLALESERQDVRVTAMGVVAPLPAPRLLEGCILLEGMGAHGAALGKRLRALLDTDALTPADVSHMLSSGDALERKCGAIAAEKLFDKHPQAIAEAAESTDDDVRRYADLVIAAKKEFERVMAEISEA
jgi:hypothetical protein